jgi:hypothetical protein
MMFVDWHEVNALYCGLIWLVALVLAVVILANSSGPTPVRHPAHHPTGALRR